jgi:hypothetical protein
MLSVYRTLAVALIALACLPSGRAEEKKPDEKTKEATSTPIKTEPATSINFIKVLDLHFESLATLGSRIEEARKNADPVALATCATYLGAAETASGKKASLTAEVLTKEAIELAKLRGQSAELKAVAALVRDAGTDLMPLVEKATKREANELARFKSGERPRGIWGYVTAVNNTGFRVFVWEDGVELGWVNPYCTYTFNRRIGHGPGHNSVLNCRSEDGSYAYRFIVDGNYQNFTWYLNP